MDAYGRNLSFDVRKVLHRMSAEGHAPGTSNDTASASLLHGDFRAENVGLKGDQVCVFDFGLAGIGPAVFDIAHLLGGSLTTPVRRRQERQLVQIYCDELRRHSVDYGFEDAWSDYRRVMPMTLPLNVIFGTSTSGSAAQVRSRRRVARRYLLAIADLLNP